MKFNVKWILPCLVSVFLVAPFIAHANDDIIPQEVSEAGSCDVSQCTTGMCCKDHVQDLRTRDRAAELKQVDMVLSGTSVDKGGKGSSKATQ